MGKAQRQQGGSEIALFFVLCNPENAAPALRGFGFCVSLGYTDCARDTLAVGSVAQGSQGVHHDD